MKGREATVVEENRLCRALKAMVRKSALTLRKIGRQQKFPSREAS